ncbi:uncharacterized protein LOC126892889 [Diabrotica virgifera virgifera]|uniref:Uncharacterized protein n=1 Tax=Diabrotica virgifera virgifera TaxID=50390 RepID=A0ABM5L8A1_DIAVI|nr:uncharacterized protein LOC126892889 [Diabrotica virgifera virgifera]
MKNVLVILRRILHKSLTSSLSEWCCKHNIIHVAINDLLNILKPYHPELPRDARTLLHTPRKTILQPINSGHYIHFGLRNCLQKLLSQYSGEECLDTVEILINIDGLPLSKSSSSQVYPILCSLYPKQGPVDIVGIYHGYEKPKDSNLFLEKFVEDAIEIINNEAAIKSEKCSDKKVAEQEIGRWLRRAGDRLKTFKEKESE